MAYKFLEPENLAIAEHHWRVGATVTIASQWEIPVISHNAFFPGTQAQPQIPVGSFEGHLSYDIKPRLWVSLDGNFWFGGRTSLNGVANPNTFQTSSRIGVTASIPMNKHQALKIGYNDFTYIRFGGNYQNISVAWQYSWLGIPN